MTPPPAGSEWLAWTQSFTQPRAVPYRVPRVVARRRIAWAVWLVEVPFAGFAGGGVIFAAWVLLRLLGVEGL